ncbi:unnamed protein product, partial [Staurois parvus]
MRHCIGSPCRAYLVLRSRDAPLQRPRPSPLADAGIRLLCSGPCDVGTYGHRRWREIRKFQKNLIFFKTILHMLCPVPCLHFDCSF